MLCVHVHVPRMYAAVLREVLLKSQPWRLQTS